MNINPINNNNRFQTNIAMQGKYRSLSAYKNIKNIPNVPCACCGGAVLVPEIITNAYKVISRPLSRILSLGIMDNWKNKASIWEFFQQMAQKYPDKSLDKILEEKDNFTEFFAATKKTFQKNDKTGQAINDIREQSRTQLRGAGPVMKRLAGIKKFLSGVDLDVFEQFQIYAQKYPRKTLSEIINMDEVANYHKTKAYLHRTAIENKQEFHFNNIQSMIKKANPDAINNFEQLKTDILSTFHKYYYDQNQCAYKVKQLVEKFLNDNECKKIKTKVLKEVGQIPTSTKSVDSFFAYAQRKKFDDYQIISTLLLPVESSFEHIIPSSQSHLDHSSNGLVMHRRCNYNRGTTPYSEFIQYHPRMPYHVQKQLNFISNLILKGESEENLVQWPIKVAKTLETYTAGKINPNYERYCERALEKSTEKFDQEQQELDLLSARLNTSTSRRDELLQELSLIQEDIKSTNKDIKATNRKKQSIMDVANMFATELSKLKSKKES